VVERFGDRAALVECRLETGRTHQIRVHMADHGHPVLGDPVYGRKPSDPALRALAETLGRQALHAAVLKFVHPSTGMTIDLESAIPPDMAALIAGLRALATPPARL
jgi:23S rRNA pseudouridine1911/1915/1917 synthase